MALLSTFLICFVLTFVLFLLGVIYLLRTISKHELLEATISKIRSAPHIRHSTEAAARVTLSKDVALVSKTRSYVEIGSDTEKEPSTVGPADGSKLK